MDSARLYPGSWPLYGGLRLPAHKTVATGEPVVRARLPARLILPLRQHAGRGCIVLVKPGDVVAKGQLLIRADDVFGTDLHAPSSGKVSAIEERPVAQPSGSSAPCIVLETDGRDRWSDEYPRPPMDYRNEQPERLRERIRAAGIVGLGGAAFPTALKLDPGGRRVALLLINGAECEPYITCDDMLMRARACKIIGGLDIMRHALQAAAVIVGIEDNKPEACTALQAALDTAGAPAAVRIQRVPTVYPGGSEKLLIRLLTGMVLSGTAVPVEHGIVCHNVGTAAAVFEAVVEGWPLVSRYITVTGDGVRRPQVLEALIGTPVADLIEQCGGYRDGVQRLLMGGSMMGFGVPSDEVPVVKGSNCILATAAATPAARPAMPCIRCGACADVCPVKLLPQQLYWYAQAADFDKTRDYDLFDCIECGCCAAVCPSHIPLVQTYRYAKTELRVRAQAEEKARSAKQRYESRLARIARGEAEQAARMVREKQVLRQQSATVVVKETKKAAIEAALARTRAKKRPAGKATKQDS